MQDHSSKLDAYCQDTERLLQQLISKSAVPALQNAAEIVHAEIERARRFLDTTYELGIHAQLSQLERGLPVAPIGWEESVEAYSVHVARVCSTIQS